MRSSLLIIMIEIWMRKTSIRISFLINSPLVYRSISYKHKNSTRQKSLGKMHRSNSYTKSNLKSNAEILKKLKSGKLGESMQVLPSLQAWKELIQLTQPQDWTNYVYYEMTKIFKSKTESDRTVGFFQDFLLPKVLLDIEE